MEEKLLIDFIYNLKSLDGIIIKDHKIEGNTFEIIFTENPELDWIDIFYKVKEFLDNLKNNFGGNYGVLWKEDNNGFNILNIYPDFYRRNDDITEIIGDLKLCIYIRSV